MRNCPCRCHTFSILASNLSPRHTSLRNSNLKQQNVTANLFSLKAVQNSKTVYSQQTFTIYSYVYADYFVQNVRLWHTRML